MRVPGGIAGARYHRLHENVGEDDALQVGGAWGRRSGQNCLDDSGKPKN